jgi:hypothetical protein
MGSCRSISYKCSILMPLKPELLRDWCKRIDEMAPPLWVLENLVQSDSAVQVTGPATRSYKTWLAMQMGLCIGSGKPCSLLKPAPEQQGVFIIEQEGPAVPTRDRFKKLEAGSGIEIASLNNFWWTHRQHCFIDNPQDIQFIANFVKEHDIRLVVLDTLAKVTRGDENSSQDASNAMRGVDAIRNANKGRTAVMYIHHIRKPPHEIKGASPDIDDEVRGSSAFNGFYDQHFALRKRFDAQKHLDLTVRGNQLPETYYSVNWYIEPERATLQMEKVEPGALSNTFKDTCILQLFPERTYTQSDLQRVWGIHSRSHVKDVIEQLLEDGAIEKAGKSYKLP